MYGLLLLAAAPGAFAADELASIGKYRTPDTPQSQQQAALATLQGLLVLRAGKHDAPEVTLDSATAQVPQKGAGRQDAGHAPQFRIEPALSSGPDGVAFELPVSDFGEFQLNLKTERSAAFSAWSLGGTLEVLAAASRKRHVAAVPTLRINDMHGREIRYLAFDASLMRGADGQDPQLAFSWRI